jgi:hypothetical protein
LPINIAGAFQHPRVKYPSKKDKDKFETFRRKVDEMVQEKGLAQRPVISDISFLEHYNELTDIIVTTAKDVFSVTKKICIEEKKLSSPTIRRMERTLRSLGGALNLERRAHLAMVTEHSRTMLGLMRQEYENERRATSGGLFMTLREYILKKRRTLYKDLYHEHMKEIITRTRTRDRRKISYSLQSGSTKKLVKTGEFIGLPTAVNSHRMPGEIMTDANGVKTATCDYLEDLYKRDECPNTTKPWMTTLSVLDVK